MTSVVNLRQIRENLKDISRTDQEDTDISIDIKAIIFKITKESPLMCIVKICNITL